MFNMMLQLLQTLATTQPILATFKVGDVNVTAMSCSAIGMGPIYYQWEKYNSSNTSWPLKPYFKGFCWGISNITWVISNIPYS